MMMLQFVMKCLSCGVKCFVLEELDVSGGGEGGGEFGGVVVIIVDGDGGVGKKFGGDEVVEFVGYVCYFYC